MNLPSLLLLASLVAAAPSTDIGLRGVSMTFPPTGRTIIRLRRGVNQRTFDAELKAMLNQDASAAPGQNSIIYQHTNRLVKGYTITATDAVKSKLKSHPLIADVEEDTYGSIEGVQSTPPSWGMSRISSRTLSLDAPYTFDDKSGEGVTVYIIDTGIDTKHPEFTNRATFGLNLIQNEADEDGEGHGTHVAGIVAGTNFGLAKKANLVAVKCCTNYGRCALSDCTAALEWVINNAKDKKNKAVVNMSLGMAPSQTLDDMVQAAVDAGIAIICSGGNNNADSCLNSPRRAPAAFAVGATDKLDRHASYSNWGKCLDIFAPGTGIISAAPGGKNVSMTGTSMASPHVAGVAALYLAQKAYDNIPQLHDDLRARATKDIVKDMRNANTTINLLAYSRLSDE